MVSSLEITRPKIISYIKELAHSYVHLFNQSLKCIHQTSHVISICLKLVVCFESWLNDKWYVNKMFG